MSLRHDWSKLACHKIGSSVGANEYSLLVSSIFLKPFIRRRRGKISLDEKIETNSPKNPSSTLSGGECIKTRRSSISDFAHGVQSLPFAADNILVQRSQSSVSLYRVHNVAWPVESIHTGARHVGHVFPKNYPSPSGIITPTYVTRCSSGEGHSSPKTASRSVQPFFMSPKGYAVQCIVIGEENPQNSKLPLPFGFRHPAGGLSHGHKQQAQKSVGLNIARVVPEISSQTDRH